MSASIGPSPDAGSLVDASPKCARGSPRRCRATVESAQNVGIVGTLRVDYEEPILLSNEIAPTPALLRAGMDALPAANRRPWQARVSALHRVFYATIRNRNTRMAYAWAVQVFDWCKDHRSLDDIEPIAIAACIEQLGTSVAKPTIKENPATIRQLFEG